MKVQTNIDLKDLNTFKVSSIAKKLIILETIEDIPLLEKELDSGTEPIILGEGANVLLVSKTIDLVIKNEIRGIKILSEDADSVTIEAGAGENWHEFVMYCAEKEWSGIENLAYIPGTVGAAPVQNLAAYGQNVGSVIVSVTGTSLTPPISSITLNQSELQLYYRDSIFKHDLKGKFIITSVIFKLSKTAQFSTDYHSRYESMEGELAKFAKPPYKPSDIALATINIRKSKLPDWKAIGTAGSFFKNPFVSKTKYDELALKMTGLQVYPVNAMLYPNPNDPVFKLSDMVKIPAGRLLDELGWKGKRIGDVGTHEKHALIIVNHGEATGAEILNFANLMKEDVMKNYGIELEIEVNII